MGKLKATVDLMYPHPSSLKLVQDAGGISKLTPEQRARVKFKHVKAGGSCDDMPATSRASFLASGKVTETNATTKRGRRD